MKNIAITLGVLFLIGFVLAGNFYWRNLRGAGPAFGPIPVITPVAISTPTPGAAQNTTGLPLTIPNGFSVSIFAKNIPDARVLVWDPQGRLLVSSPGTGTVFALSPAGDRSVVIGGLNQPHGLAFKDDKVYIAETDAVAVYDYDQSAAKASNRKKIIDIPGGGNHFSRTIGFGPDGKLYIAIGSTCNVCVESNPFRAKILVANADGSDLKVYASGLRNAVFFIWKGNDMWATLMGRDSLGDDIPPDTLDIIKQGKDYGWPYCYGKQVWDKTFDSSQKAGDFCKTTEPSFVDLQAHSAPLGLAFVPKSWGQDYANTLLVAFHGSWNRTVPTGYKLVLVRFDDKGNYQGVSDFITGWLVSSGALGRPVDVLFDGKGNLFVSDDKAGVIYTVKLLQP